MARFPRPSWSLPPRAQFKRPRVHDESPVSELLDDVLEENILRVGPKIFFYSEVSTKAALRFTSVLEETVKEHLIRAAENRAARPDPIYVHIHSEGGCLFSGLTIMDTIRVCPVEVITVVDGYCASAATLMLMGAKDRRMQRHASVLIHQLRTEFWGRFDELLDEVENSKVLMSKLKQIYTEDTNLSRRQIDSLVTKELYMDSKQCLENGIVGTIM